MKEAFRLLNKSIIRVEQPDINLQEENEEEEMEVDEPPAEVDNNGNCAIHSIWIAVDLHYIAYAKRQLIKSGVIKDFRKLTPTTLV